MRTANDEEGWHAVSSRLTLAGSVYTVSNIALALLCALLAIHIEGQTWKLDFAMSNL